jgi:hypothetical protein
MFIGYQEEIIEGSEVPTLFISHIAETREELENMPCVSFAKIEETSDEYVLKDGKYMLKSVVDALQVEEDKQARISELKQLLANTDYIDNKFLEAIVKNDMILLDTLKVKYKDKLEERQAIRNQIDELEEMING